MIADSYACKQRHWSKLVFEFELHRPHPSLKHEANPLAVPLYPVEMTLFYEFTITAPTELFMQFDRRLAISAIFIK